jgi:peptidoglycan/LPS O-acetylase OafA/YrhL
VERPRIFLKSHGRAVLSLAAAGGFFIVLLAVVLSVWPAASVIRIEAEFDHPDRFQVYYSNGLRKISFKEQYSRKSNLVPEGERTTVSITMGDSPVARARLDVGDLPGTVNIYGMTVLSHFAKPVHFDAQGFYEMFRPGKDDVSVVFNGDHVTIVSQEEDPYLVAAGPLILGNRIVPYGLAFAFSAVLFLFLLRFDYASFPAFYDISRKKPSSGRNITSLDGLRGLATLIIVADHTIGQVIGIGAIGVWLFMALSGFLLAKPFVKYPQNALSLQYMTHFFSRRIRRIVPLYYAYLTVIFLINRRFDEAFRHYMFLQGDGVLWVINQEMVFYLSVPFIMAMNYLLFRGRPWLIIAGLAVLTYLTHNYMSRDVFSLYGMNRQDLRLFAGIFFAGMAASYLYYGVYERSGFYRTFHERFNRRVFSWMGLALLAGFLLGTTGTMWGLSTIPGLTYYQWYGIAAAVFIFLIIGSDNSPLDRLLSLLPLRAIGLVSFSIYVLHPVIIKTLRLGVEHYTDTVITGIPMFLLTIAAAYIVSCMTYTYIERPFTR